MTAHIKHVQPDLVELSELRGGDNFQHPSHGDWVFKKVTGVKQFISESSKNNTNSICYAVTECSGEVIQFKESDKVYPLIEPQVMYEYDFERQFETKREG